MTPFPWTACGRGMCLLEGLPCGTKKGLDECSPRPETIYPGATPTLEGNRVVTRCPANCARAGFVASAAASVTPVAARNCRRVRPVILFLLVEQSLSGLPMQHSAIQSGRYALRQKRAHYSEPQWANIFADSVDPALGVVEARTNAPPRAEAVQLANCSILRRSVR